MTVLIDNLNTQQRKAVETTEGRVLILAGAGTGKTLVLTTRAAFLIKSKGVPPESILGLTFTNKAAGEMRKRLAQLVDEASAKKVTLCTFHSFCLQVLRKEIHHLGYTSNFTLYQPSDVERLVKAIAHDILESDGELPSLAATMAQINRAKNLGLDPDEISEGSDTWHDKFVKKVYRRLLESMRAHNAVDFDNLLTLTAELFTHHPEIASRYQDRYRYIMIDEYQDTNPIQYRLASLLSSQHGNLCVVGDDDQSIYGWRGADIRNILEFDQATVVKLEQNYRSTPMILNAANAVITNNENRHHKNLWSQQAAGDQIRVFHSPSEKLEAEAVVYRIIKLKKTLKLHWKDFAILYRSNALSRQFEQVLLRTSFQMGDHWRKGIPYKIFGGLEFFERREIKDLFSYLRVVVNRKDEMSVLRTINLPRRGIGERTLDQLTQFNRENEISLWEVMKLAVEGVLPEVIQSSLSKRSLTGIQNYMNIIEEASSKFDQWSLRQATLWLLDTIDFKRAIQEDVKSQKMRDFKWENVEELVSSLAEFEESGEGTTLNEYITSTPLQESDRKNNQNDDDTVQLMTFHSAKGLEFPVCFLIGLEDHIIPHERSLQETGVEEERRLMYVAMTRAKKMLYLSMSQQRSRMGVPQVSKPSRFLYEIPKDLLKICRFDQMEND